MLIATVGESIPLVLLTEDGNSSVYPRVFIFDSSGLAVATLNLSHISLGYYQVNWTVPTDDRYTLIYLVYSDAGFTQINQDYSRSTEQVLGILGPVLNNGIVRQGFTLDVTTNTIYINTWLEINDQIIQSSISNGTTRIYDIDGNPLTALSAGVGPDTNGIFKFSIASPGFAIGETGTYSIATIDFNGTTFRGVTAITFSRSS